MGKGADQTTNSLRARSVSDAKDKKTVDEAEKAIEAQIQKLAALQKSKGC